MEEIIKKLNEYTGVTPTIKYGWNTWKYKKGNLTLLSTRVFWLHPKKSSGGMTTISNGKGLRIRVL